jgi:nitrogen-specific signal transduction histidine kinase
VAFEHSLPSALSHFDPTDLLDALSTGILMLDAQLCPIYANVAAQDLLAFSLKKARGRPFSDFLHDTDGFVGVLRRVLDTGEAIADRELTMRPIGAPRETRTLDVTITPLEGQITGTHLLLELADTTQRQRITRENDLLARLDSSRLMVRQLAHEIKNPLGGASCRKRICASTPRSSSEKPIGWPHWWTRWPDPAARHRRVTSTFTRSASTSSTC